MSSNPTPPQPTQDPRDVALSPDELEEANKKHRNLRSKITGLLHLPISTFSGFFLTWLSPFELYSSLYDLVQNDIPALQDKFISVGAAPHLYETVTQIVENQQNLASYTQTASLSMKQFQQRQIDLELPDDDKTTTARTTSKKADERADVIFAPYITPWQITAPSALELLPPPKSSRTGQEMVTMQQKLDKMNNLQQLGKADRTMTPSELDIIYSSHPASIKLSTLNFCNMKEYETEIKKEQRSRAAEEKRQKDKEAQLLGIPSTNGGDAAKQESDDKPPPPKPDEDQLDPDIFSSTLLINQIPTKYCNPKEIAPSFTSIIYTSFRRVIFMLILSELLTYFGNLIQPYTIKLLFSYFNRYKENETSVGDSEGVILSIIIGLISLANSISLLLRQHFLCHFATPVTAALLSAFFTKTLRIAPYSIHNDPKMNIGYISNLVSNDAQVFFAATFRLLQLISGPIAIVICLILMYFDFGSSTLILFLLLLLMVPYQLALGEFRRRLEVAYNDLADIRGKYVINMLNSIRVVKVYGWESLLIRQTTILREQELSQLKKVAAIIHCSDMFAHIYPMLINFITLSVYVSYSTDLSPEKVVLLISYLSSIYVPLQSMGEAIAGLFRMKICLTRISDFLKKEEIPVLQHRLQNFLKEGLAYKADHALKHHRSVAGGSGKTGVLDVGQQDSEDSYVEESTIDVNDRVSINPLHLATSYGMKMPFSRSFDAINTMAMTIGNANEGSLHAPNPAATTPTSASTTSSNAAISLSNLDLYWSSFDSLPWQLPILTNINLSIEATHLIGVVSPQAAGKTALLQSMLGELYPQPHKIHSRLSSVQNLPIDSFVWGSSDGSGTSPAPALSHINQYFSFNNSIEVIPPSLIDLFGTVAYCPQQPWILTDTIRNNIIVSLPFDREKFLAVVEAAALGPDLSIFPNGDLSIASNSLLSGGQKARLQFARALYFADHADVFLFDDIFAAVDATVARTMFYKGIKGILKGKTIVLALNSHYDYLQECDKVVVLHPTTTNFSGFGSNTSYHLGKLDIVQECIEEEEIDELGQFDEEMPEISLDNITPLFPTAQQPSPVPTYPPSNTHNDPSSRNNNNNSNRIQPPTAIQSAHASSGSNTPQNSPTSANALIHTTNLQHPSSPQSARRSSPRLSPLTRPMSASKRPASAAEVIPPGPFCIEFIQKKYLDCLNDPYWLYLYQYINATQERVFSIVKSTRQRAVLKKEQLKQQKGKGKGKGARGYQDSSGDAGDYGHSIDDLGAISTLDYQQKITKVSSANARNSDSPTNQITPNKPSPRLSPVSAPTSLSTSPHPSTTLDSQSISGFRPPSTILYYGDFRGLLKLDIELFRETTFSSQSQIEIHSTLEKAMLDVNKVGQINSELEQLQKEKLTDKIETTTLHSMADPTGGPFTYNIQPDESVDETKEPSVLTPPPPPSMADSDIPPHIFRYYFQGAYSTTGLVLIILSLTLSTIISQAFRSAYDVVLLRWSEDEQRATLFKNAQSLIEPYYPRSTWITLTACIMAASCFGFIGQSITVLFIWTNGSRHTFASALRKILNTTIPYLDTISIGTIINKVAGRDLSTVDTILPDYLLFFLQQLFVLLGILGLSVYSSFLYVLPILPIILYILIIRRPAYHISSTQLQRLQSAAMSPIYTLFNSIVHGTSSIRHYPGFQHHFTKQFHTLVNNWLQIKTTLLQIETRFGWFINLLTSLYVLIIVLAVVLGRAYFDLDLSMLAISYIFRLVWLLQFVIRFYVQATQNLTSVQRIELLNYIPQESEEPTSPQTRAHLQARMVTELANKAGNTTAQYKNFLHQLHSHNPSSLPYQQQVSCELHYWPWHGEIAFKNVTVRYRADLPIVLNNLTFTINPGESIGVVGRTGSGKSTLLNLFPRTLLPESGVIEIDGIDIAQLGISDVRKRMAIIPQTPTLFQGTIRSNLDPFGKYDDNHMWFCLEMVGLKNKVVEMANGLDSLVSEGGANLSASEQQSLCIARALLTQYQTTSNSAHHQFPLPNRATVLIGDEITAMIPNDAAVQDAIANVFSSATRIMIAHRLKTIIDCDRILVLRPLSQEDIDNNLSSLLEYEHPFILLNNRDSKFYHMCVQHGPEQFNELYQRAMATYQKKFGSEVMNEWMKDRPSSTLSIRPDFPGEFSLPSPITSPNPFHNNDL